MRARSLRAFVALSLGLTLLRFASALAFLAMGPGFAGPHAVAEGAFVLSKAILGGLFWFISFPLEGWRNPIGWLFYPWP